MEEYDMTSKAHREQSTKTPHSVCVSVIRLLIFARAQCFISVHRNVIKMLFGTRPSRFNCLEVGRREDWRDEDKRPQVHAGDRNANFNFRNRNTVTFHTDTIYAFRKSRISRSSSTSYHISSTTENGAQFGHSTFYGQTDWTDGRTWPNNP